MEQITELTQTDDEDALGLPDLVGRLVLVGFAVVAMVATLTWVSAAMLMTGRGFDITDEGFYLLSYRWWSTNLRDFTGAQYFYGPVFGVLGHDIVALRWFRLGTILVTYALFAWAFMVWLRGLRPHAPGTKIWEAAGALAIVAAGGMMYSWLPLSAGYNDLAILGSFLGLSLVLVAAHCVDRGTAIPWWVPMALGVVALGLLLNKWTMAPQALLLVLAGLVVAYGESGWRAVRRVCGWGLSGTIVALVVVHVFVVPLDAAIPPIVDVNRLSSEGDHPPGEVLESYWLAIRRVFEPMFEQHFMLLAASIVVGAVRRGVASIAAGVLAIGVLGISVIRIVKNHGFDGGHVYGVPFSSGLLTMAMAVALVALASRVSGTLAGTTSPPRPRTLLLVALLALLPLSANFGTSASLFLAAASAFAATLALMLWLITSLPSASVGARAFAFAVTACTVIACGLISRDALLDRPYRTTGYDDSTAVVANGTTPLGSLRVTPPEARQYAALRRALRPHLRPAPASVMAFDKMPGLVLLLGARPVGESWTGPTATLRSAEGLKSECRDGQLNVPPILMYNRAPAQLDQEALEYCGWTIGEDYRELEVPKGPPGVRVFVPVLDPA